MKGVRFYLEYKTPTEKNKGTRANPGNHMGTVVAAFVDNGLYKCGQGEHCYDAVGGLHSYENSPVVSTSASLDYLKENCLRISEEQAREIHPRLFEVLDAFPQPTKSCGRKQGGLNNGK